MVAIAHLEQKAKSGATKSQLLSSIDMQFGKLQKDEQSQIATICCEEMLRNKTNAKKPKILEDEIERVLSRVGWKFKKGTLLPIEVLNFSELKELPKKSHEDILKAGVRLRDGDFSGSISACCGAVDTITEKIFQKYDLGDHKSASFQERISKSLKALEIKDSLENELTGVGWSTNEINIFVNNLVGSLNQASNVMQKLRANMSDVHGTKPVIKALVFDTIKWSAILLRILNK